jgi:hypothetical protein
MYSLLPLNIVTKLWAVHSAKVVMPAGKARPLIH